MDSMLKVDVFSIDESTPEIGNSPATGEPFRLLENEDLAQELALVGIQVGQEDPTNTAAIEAEAAVFLRRAGECDAETDRLKATMQKQIEVVMAHYGQRIQAAQRRYAECVRHVEYLASIAQYPKRAKSFATPFGAFGRRDRSATVQLADSSALLDWAKAEQPTHVRAVLTSTLADPSMRDALEAGQDVKLAPEWNAIKKTLDPDGTLPPGVMKVEARTEFYAAPELPFTEETESA